VIIPIDAETRFVVERTRRGGIGLYTESRCLCQSETVLDMSPDLLASIVRRDEAGNCRDCGGDPERQWSSPPDEGTGIDAQHVGALREALRQLEEGASSPVGR
jgi:hypothetical protein